MLLLLIYSLLVCEIRTYDFVCPHTSHRQFRSMSVCGNKLKEKYSCLQDEHTNLFLESCSNNTDYVRAGQRYVISGMRTNTNCSYERFQPFKFWSNESSHCVFHRSHCGEIGQLVYEGSTSKEDNMCGCNVNHGYSLLTKNNNRCLCIPAMEDCTCYTVQKKPSEDHQDCGSDIPTIPTRHTFVKWKVPNEVHLSYPNRHEETPSYLTSNSEIKQVVLIIIITVIIALCICICVTVLNADQLSTKPVSVSFGNDTPKRDDCIEYTTFAITEETDVLEKRNQTLKQSVEINKNSSNKCDFPGDNSKANNLPYCLKRYGLDAKYWVPVLHGRMGISTVTQIKYLEEDDMLILSKYTRFTWETKAFKKLLVYAKEKLSVPTEHSASSFHSPKISNFQGSRDFKEIKNGSTEDPEEKLFKHRSQLVDVRSEQTETKTERCPEEISTCLRFQDARKGVNVESILKKLGLERFYPQKMNLQDVIKIESEINGNMLSDIPWIFLKNLMMNNYEARDVLVGRYLDKLASQSSIGMDFHDEEQNGIDGECIDLNPLDLIVVIFKCCSPILWQVLSQKMFLCRLAIPFAIAPDYNILPELSTFPMKFFILDGGYYTVCPESSFHRPCHVVSFIRVGKLSLSKSKLMNQIIADQYHDTFFNNDCPQGAKKRILSEGMVEMSWYVPSNQRAKMTAYLNLRGDGLIFEQQRTMLSQISSVVVVMLNIRDLGNSIIRTVLKKVHQNVHSVVLAFDALTLTESEASRILKNYMQEIERFKEKTGICKLAADGRSDSLSCIKKNIVFQIKNFLNKTDAVPFSSRLQNGEHAFFRTDEDAHIFKQAHKKVDTVFHLLPNECIGIKDSIVPLQARMLRTYRKKQETIKQLGQNQTLNRFPERMRQERLDQLKTCTNLGPFMNAFLKTLLDNKQTDEDRSLFITYLKYRLEDRYRHVLPHILKTFNCQWQALQDHGQRSFKKGEQLQEDYINTQYELVGTSFGFEHLVRECGQIYEAFNDCGKECSDEMQWKNAELARIIAKIFLQGQPFELMDCDASYVPLTWIRAVLQELKSLIGDKKLLTVSLVGNKSSGKSTLLNTMFGLQLDVSARRFSRGVFVQLVPVADKNDEFEYIFLIYTKGIRLPVLENEDSNVGNNIDTLVLGLGDIVLYNIKGESIAEMEHVLQIDFLNSLRLKMRSSYLKMKQSFIVVHQNVSQINASVQLMQTRQNLVEKLDKITQKAATLENIQNISSFDEVIDFDIDKDVKYFSDLWVGNPPEAHYNPGYIKDAEDVKQMILSKLTMSKNICPTLSDTIKRIEDFWNGILTGFQK